MTMKGWTEADCENHKRRDVRNASPHPAMAGVQKLTPIPKKERRARRKGPNETEQRFNRDHLDGLGMFEAITFKLLGGSRYTPDWVYFDNRDGMHVYEVKGSYAFHSENRALTAFRECRAQFRRVKFEWWMWDGGKWIQKYAED